MTARAGASERPMDLDEEEYPLVKFDDDADATVRIRGLKKSFGSSTILDGLDLDFLDGSITTILGPSGTGKSVMIKHVVGLLEPDEGMVRVFDQDLWALTEGERMELATNFGILFQDGALFGSMNIFDNVAFPLRQHTDKDEDEIEQITMDSLEEVGLSDALEKYPGEISGGMKKRAGYARALILNPKVVMFDEPDSGLDPVRTSLLNDLIMKMHDQHKGTYVLVTHDIATARKVSDYIGVLWKGRLIHFGPTKDAFETDSDFVRQFLTGDSNGPLGMD